MTIIIENSFYQNSERPSNEVLHDLPLYYENPKLSHIPQKCRFGVFHGVENHFLEFDGDEI